MNQWIINAIQNTYYRVSICIIKQYLHVWRLTNPLEVEREAMTSLEAFLINSSRIFATKEASILLFSADREAGREAKLYSKTSSLACLINCSRFAATKASKLLFSALAETSRLASTLDVVGLSTTGRATTSVVLWVLLAVLFTAIDSMESEIWGVGDDLIIWNHGLQIK